MRLATLALLGALTPLGCATSGGGPRGLDVALPGLDGTLVTPTPATGDEIYVFAFWATWCQPCQSELTKLDALYAEKKARGLEVYAINIDSPDTTAQVGPWVEREGYSFPVLIDRETQVLTRYNPRGDIPYYVVLDANGKILHDHQGYMSGDIDELSAFLDTVLRPG